MSDYESAFSRVGLDYSKYRDVIDPWCIGPKTAHRLIDYIEDNEPQLVVECGSGISTILMAKAVSKYGGHVVAMEDDQKYYERTLRWLREELLHHKGSVIESPLEGVIPFYSNFPRDTLIDMIVVDGPPANKHPLARYKAKRLFSGLSNGGIIFLDDTHRNSEKLVVQLWADEVPGLDHAESFEDGEKRCSVFSLNRKEKERVFVSVPTRGSIHKQVVVAMLGLTQEDRYDIHIKIPTYIPVENAYNRMIGEVLDGGFDWWLNIDDDNPPKRRPLDLIRFNKDIIACPTPIWHNPENLEGIRPYCWNVFQHHPENDTYIEHYEKEGLQKVDAVGMGCTLISRRVLEHPEMQKAPFLRKWHEDGTVRRGTDIAFCERARENGFEVWAHFDYVAMHFKQVELLETIRCFNDMKLNDEETLKVDGQKAIISE